MKNRIILYPYKIASESAASLQTELNTNLNRLPTRRVHPDGTYRQRNTDVVVNWGNSSTPNWILPESNAVLNRPASVARASNKISAFVSFTDNGIVTPQYTARADIAEEWLRNGDTVIERHTLTGHSGAGIRIVRPTDFLTEAPLYVKYKKKRSEYRVHVFNGTVLFVQEKRRERERERTADESLIRSHSNGWVFCREDVEISPMLIATARGAVEALGLDFGAVDIIYNQHENQYYVLEVNTAPGLEGQSVVDYTRAINEWFNTFN
jgi:hypothetical protein